MVEPEYKIVWSRNSQQQLERIFKYILYDSEKNARVVLEEIVSSINKAQHNPEFYGPDKFKENNDGSYRAYEIHHYRVSYRFAGDTIRILRVRHTSMKPKEY